MSGKLSEVLEKKKRFFSYISFFLTCIPKESPHIREAKVAATFIYQILRFTDVRAANLLADLEGEDLEGSRHEDAELCLVPRKFPGT